MSDFRRPCDCHTCSAATIHRPDACRRVGRWLITEHKVDECRDGEVEGWLCQKCFDARINAYKQIIGWGMEGVRAPMCSTCNRPIVRLSSILTSVEQ